jgi:hypothetical protein
MFIEEEEGEGEEVEERKKKEEGEGWFISDVCEEVFVVPPDVELIELRESWN